MVGPGWNRSRLAPRKNGGETDPRSIAGHRLGDGKLAPPIPSHSRILREGMRQYSSSTSMQVSTCQPIMMWLPREWPAITLIWSWVQQRAQHAGTLYDIGVPPDVPHPRPSYISPVLLEAAKNLLPSMEECLAGGDFQGTWDLRVLERAKTLQVAVWLHCLDMATNGDGKASYSLEVTWHGREPLVRFLLAPQTVASCLRRSLIRSCVENWVLESSLDHVLELWAQLQRDLNDLSRLAKVSLRNLPARR